MQEANIVIENSTAEGHTITNDMFGANILFDRDQLGDGTYDDVVETLNINTIRYPGGFISELYFDLNDPNASEVFDEDGNPVSNHRGPVELLPMDEFMDYAAANNINVTIVLPTIKYLNVDEAQWKAEVETFVYEMLRDNPDVNISAIEIGNEWWGSELTASEYGHIASSMASSINDAIESYLEDFGLSPIQTEPLILVQTGGRVRTDGIGREQNNEVIAEFSQEELDIIDGVITHMYATSSTLPNADQDFNHLGFEHFLAWENAAGKTLATYISEWNVQSPEGVDGLQQAVVILNMFDEFVQRGIDLAAIWPVQQNNQSDLSGNEGQTDLTIAGELFRMMSESLVGMQAIDVGTGREDINLHAYRNDDRIVLFFASHTDKESQLNVDLSKFVPSYFHVSGRLLSAVNGKQDGIPDHSDHKSDPFITTFSESELFPEDNLEFMLQPYEIIKIEFVINESDLILEGQDQLVETPYMHQGDELIGALGYDTIHGHFGDDTLIGKDGDDEIFGGDDNDIIIGNDGADTLNGDAGNDHINGGVGNDMIFGGLGDDTLKGNKGSDTIFGDEGQDHLIGSLGNDFLYGGIDDDSLYGNLGDDTLYGDEGNDIIIGGLDNDEINGGLGDDTLRGGADNDMIYGGGNNDIIFGGAGDDLIYGGDGGDELRGGVGNDIIEGNEGDDLIYGGAGDDTIIGGTGSDTLAGNEGSDVFIFNDLSNEGHDAIIGFDTETDLLHLNGIPTLDILNIEQQEGNVVINFGDGSITLLNTDILALNVDNFIFDV